MSKEIALTQGMVAIVDDEDYDCLSQYRWHYHAKTGYARRGEGGRKNHVKIYMHRQVMNAPNGVEVDHIHGYKLDNRKSELRLCSHQDNIRNQTLTSAKRLASKTSPYKGVCRADNRWVATITIHYRTIRIGAFVNEVDAAKAYDAAARLHFGEFARCNLDNHTD